MEPSGKEAPSSELLSSGYKASLDDPSKLPLHLIPNGILQGLGRSLAYGAIKYEDHNWRLGLPWGEVYSALLRHLTAWWDSEECDMESGLSHLDHAAACLAFLMEYANHLIQYDQFDNRWKGQK